MNAGLNRPAFALWRFAREDPENTFDDSISLHSFVAYVHGK
jgi:hypothetical protein